MTMECMTVDYGERTDECYSVIDELANEYVRYVETEHEICRQCPAPRSGPFIVHSMLEWKAIYADGQLDQWTRGDIREYLLDHFPRKISGDDQLLFDTPTCVRDFIYFLADRGTLRGDPMRDLADYADEIAEEFLAACSDRRNWGMAKRFVSGGGLPLLVDPVAFPRSSSARSRPLTSTSDSVERRRDQRRRAKASRRRNRR